MQRTKIEYLTHTWNPIAMRCSPVSPGCANCWHLAMAKRLAGNPRICNEFKNAYAGAIPPVLIHTEVEAPLHLKRSARIGVQFMGDLFHGSLSCDMIRDVLWNIQRCGWHTFFILTKRAGRMKEFFEGAPTLDNLWLGVSVEDQKTADERIPILLQIPAAHRWVSIEPMLGPVDLSIGVAGQILGACDLCGGTDSDCPGCRCNDGINWVVLGGETGSGARPIHPDWVRSIRDQCQGAGVPFFFKSWGDYEKKYNAGSRYDSTNTGRLLDGREWEEPPK
jgi:protein gp37